MTLKNFIKKRRDSVWYVKEPENLSQEAIVEAVLNYGDFDDVKKLFSILGVRKTAMIFRKQTQRERINYDPKIAHYFNLYFKKHAR
ncbi:MAG: hypothetical protein UV43_C0029G0007 [Parcubacteria group bacterium GW2011_GWF2_42_7]|nr:MAG: hypothetical protein UV43_C0029G0007 [Parcubacteria group bacterium GW2011_GWF2_42_7]